MTDTKNTAPAPRKVKRDTIIAATCGVVVAGMVGAAFASVPLYNWFCRTTGFGGTTQVSEAAPGQVLDRTLTVRFDSNVAPGLPWRFVPEQNTVQVRIGEVKTVYYKVINMAAREITAQAGYNVTPPTVGLYFHKINCFCFTEQTMKPGETRDMAVVFYVDPSLVKDSDQDPLNTITLSYTFFPVDAPQKPVADAEPKTSKKL
ncbi:cytochrome C oxidase assembly protein [Pseudolabrys sp. Root1462]|jgi:cytochrome c oxidase assembly protein subunit 11|uniref:cytochrome c oxidase assembly protein n=1 Tax=Pseudolabrys sp. Root1462 TaxID=1736466 RepID=UPI00070362A0|nr:cytochrome c oxidase assembly protein [Pseudolabrys sp. Root1462]KQY98287.1 cytochrome C oxidase assembly protein [Pseudolabrys sp. Root1462]